MRTREGYRESVTCNTFDFLSEGPVVVTQVSRIDGDEVYSAFKVSRASYGTLGVSRCNFIESSNSTIFSFNNLLCVCDNSCKRFCLL